ncbi:hypothetical protein DFJ77DRAFT_430274 [Powellomyces hirtus]|nr:hypothetical protein DFJ77DRAFT_430274 [Powellomyces hirtus]
MRAHFKSDWHRYNIKRKLQEKPPVSEDVFDELAEVSSIEASDSEDDDNAGAESKGPDVLQRESGSPFLLLPLGSDRMALRVYRELVTGKKRDELETSDVVKRLQDHVSPKKGAHWTLLMLAAGHFAGIVIDCKSGKTVAHKTFHRYTTRRKQGGAQNASDAAKGVANSAGSTLRRYNEQALKEEIRDLLTSWKTFLDESQLIFIRVAPINRRALYYDGSPLDSLGDRIRSFPFTTRRPTLGELNRCFKELTTAYLTKLEELRAPPEPKASNPKPSEKKPDSSTTSLAKEPAVPVLEPELAKLVDFCKRGKADLILSFLQSNESIDVNKDLTDAFGTSFLHVAASNDQPEAVDALLSAGADPTKGTEKKNQRPYDVASSKETRDSFRRFVAKKPDLWDWKAAHVPGPLTPEMEQQQKDKDREKKKKQKEKQKAYNAAKAAATPPPEPEAPAVSSASKKAAFSKLTKTEREAVGMTPERRAALDREKRALAAEARIRGRMNQCAACGKSLLNVTPFEKFMFRYCSIFCVQVKSW